MSGPLELAGRHWLTFAAGMLPAELPAASAAPADDAATLAELLATLRVVGKRLTRFASRLDAIDVNDARRAGADQAHIADELRELALQLVRT